MPSNAYCGHVLNFAIAFDVELAAIQLAMRSGLTTVKY